MSIAEKYSFDKVDSIQKDLLDERSEWESEYRQISDYLLPGRGIYQTYTKPRKRKLTTKNVINTVGEDALYVLTSGMHGRLTSPAMPWFRLKWADAELNFFEPLKAWLQESESLLHGGLHNSSFYSVINSFYIEYAGFGTGSMYIGEDTDDANIPFRFELLTAGEYSFSMGLNGTPSVFIRTLFMSPRQLVERFGNKVSESKRKRVENNAAGADKVELAIYEFIIKDTYQDKDYVRIFYEVSAEKPNRSADAGKPVPLQIDGFYEHPYPIARWGTIGSDTYGIGPGARAIPDIKRLQEMERAFLMATHKGIDPPLNAPSRMRGKLNSLPGGRNYYKNPTETVNQLYQVNFDYQGVSAAIERVEQRIQRNFFNDVFLTASRDPNASPLKAAQVQSQEQEKMFRLGPVTERLYSEFFSNAIKRCFNIMKRKDMFPALDPQFEDMIQDFEVELISPMAVAQRAVKSQGVDAFMGYVSQAAQFDPTVLDNVDADASVRQRADIEGVDIGILRSEEEVAALREQRAKQQEAQAKAEQDQQNADQSSYLDSEDASTRKVNAEAGQILAETQQVAAEAGLQ